MVPVWIGYIVAVVVFAVPSLSQLANDCPLGWETFDGHCYRFTFHPTRTYTLALTACEMDGASLVSVNTDAEHEFVSGWLTRHDMDRSDRWWTSGIGAGQQLQWEGDGTSSVLDQSNKWAGEGLQQRGNLRVVYKFTTLTNTFLWGRQYPNETLPYICEISQAEAFRISQAARDHSFGTDSSNPEEVPRGPRLSIRPESVVVIGGIDSAFIECAADSNPAATYTWYKMVGDNNEHRVISTAMDSRYSLTNGRFSFQQPQESKDAGEYYCEAENIFGTIRSHPVSVSFGYLGEFSNDPPGGVRANQYQGTYLDCNPPRFNPTASFQWYKGPGANFLRTDLNTYQFVSYNGKLYFSETQLADAGQYYCVVTLTAPLGQHAATVQPPSATSLGIELIIRGDTATEFGPIIHNDFPAVYPAPALRGENLRIECFAYGRLPLYYSWRRDNGPIPDKAEIQEEGRVLNIPDAQLEDSGNYTCRVERGTRASDEKAFGLTIEAVPFFVFPLRDQHVDINSQVSLRCEAMAVPLPVYSWFKNGQPLTSTPDDVEVRGNVVVIKHADPTRHNGMYECSASNVYGTRISSAQLRVLSFAPNFGKRPLDSSQMATMGGNATIICQPEAAPAPEITWSHNGRPLGLTAGAQGRVMKLDNGNLMITQLTMSDQGEYTCTAINTEGEASSTGLLSIVKQTSITVPPRNTQVEVNSTAFLSCEASFDQQHHDLAYIWSFNGYTIDVGYDPNYRQSTQAGRSGLYIINAQFKHEGYYTCDATTVDDKASKSAYLTVRGPPSEPAGLYGKLDGRNVILSWTVGSSHGAPILFFVLEHMSNFFPTWRVKIDRINVAEAVDQEYPDRRSVTVTDLSPGSSYTFRIRAVNRYGVGTPSVKSAYFKIPDAPPLKAPDGIQFMISTVGTLAFTWNDTLYGRVNSYVALVGADYYYLEYEVKVAAFNYLGQGPNSSVTIVMSAEDLPVATPTNTNGEEYNGTAVYLYWDPIPNTREFMKGKILGYQINYWWEEDPSYLMSYNVYCDDCGQGLVIGLEPDSDYWWNVQVFNTAGLGPKGEDYRISTFLYPPQHYTEYVAVHSHGEDSVYVTWRGVQTFRTEDPLIGYKLRWWPATENILSANYTVIESKRTSGVIEGVKEGIVYALRVLAYNAGGDGKNSPTVFFTLEGQVVYNPETTEILATGCHATASLWTLLMAVIMTWLCLV
ncbi:hypothetical protein BaRGS_00026309 [Batillaria attramentaria]|uniref:Contactin n=1 Tax=Batillaria attramentaria TaxID=370345 RepID=A0ABD0K6Q6_9CAEN